MKDQLEGNTSKEDKKQTPQKRYRAIIRLDYILSKAESFVTILCFVLMCAFVIIGIVMRFILKIPNMYGEEASRYLMVCGVFIGVSIGVRKKAHLGMTTLVDMLPVKISKIIYIIGSIITICGYTVLAWYAWKFVELTYGFKQTSAAMTLPMWIVYFTIMIGLILSAFRSIIVFWSDFIAPEKILAGGENSPW